MIYLLVPAAAWLTLGLWLTLDGLKQVMPRIVAQGDPLPLRLIGITIAIVAGTIWLPVRFFRALVRK